MTEFLTAAVAEGGYPAIFVLLALARAIPPLPTGTVLPIAGLAAAAGEANLFLVGLAGGLGSAAGEFAWYALARRYGRVAIDDFIAKFGRYMGLRRDDAARAAVFVQRRGALALVLAQPVPVLRTFVSIPAGAYGVSAGRFLLATAAGAVPWATVLASLGYGLHAAIPGFEGLLGWATVGTFVLLIVIYLVRLRRRPGN